MNKCFRGRRVIASVSKTECAGSSPVGSTKFYEMIDYKEFEVKKEIHDYVESAEEHEAVFRMLLNRFKIEHEKLSVKEIFEKYSTGHRRFKWTILNFREVEPNVFEFGWEDIGILSGDGSIDLYTTDDTQLLHVKNIYYWKS